MTDIIIVRHGNTFDPGDTVLRVGARTDLPLSTSGRDQAERLAATFQDEFPTGFNLAYCSPLRRTRETAETILNAYKQPPSLQVEPFLTEIDYGPDEGQAEDRVVARLGADAIARWDREAIPPRGWNVDPDQILRDWRTFFARAAKLNERSLILVVTSNGTARFALDAITKNRARTQELKLKTGAYGVVRLSGDEVELVAWNLRPARD